MRKQLTVQRKKKTTAGTRRRQRKRTTSASARDGRSKQKRRCNDDALVDLCWAEILLRSSILLDRDVIRDMRQFRLNPQVRRLVVVVIRPATLEVGQDVEA